MNLRFLRRKRNLVALVPIIALPIVGAAAYMLANSSSTFTNNGGSVTAPAALIVTGRISGSDHSVDTWALGGTQPYLVIITNPGTNPGPALVQNITLTGFTSNQAGCNSVSLPGMFTAPVQVANATLQPGGLAYNAPVFNVTAVNLGVDQSACKGAAVIFDWATN